MKLLLFVCLGLGAVATVLGYNGLVMDTEPDSSDIDHEDIVKDETSRANNPSSVMRKWKERDGIITGPENEDIMNALTGGYRNVDMSRMFDENSGYNRETQPSSPNTHQCRHKTHLLQWFPYISSAGKHHCYIPWANAQGITYAQCVNSDCNTGFELEGQRFDLHSHLHPKKCRPSCYRKRVLVAYCCRLYTKRWYWKVVVRHLPQACVCSNCPCADSSVCTGCYRKYYNV